MNLFDIIYTGISPYFAFKFLRKYKDIKTSMEYCIGRMSVGNNCSHNKGKVLLFHGASIGETQLLLPLAQKFLSFRPQNIVILTTATHTAYKLLKEKTKISNVFYLPFDFVAQIKRFFDKLNPSVLILAEQEIWPNLLLEAKKRRIKIVFVNFRIKPPKACLYQTFFYKGLLQRCIDKFFCIDDFTLSLLQKLDIADNKLAKIANLKVLPFLENKLPTINKKMDLVAFLSIHKGEEKEIENIYAALNQRKNLKCIFLPRHINYSNYFSNFFQRKYKTVISDSIEDILAMLSNPQQQYEMLIVNKYGIVKDILEFTKYTVMGGTFINLGGHNILEPLFYSNKVLVGPYFQNIKSEVEKGIKNGIVYTSLKDDFLEYNDKIYSKCCNFFSDIENPLNIIIPYLLAL
jgi:3-deoxy-D-manno-octulosonic-acid transferase